MHALARALSIAGHPFATALLFAWAAGARAGAAPRGLLLAAAVILPIAALVAWQRRSGRWTTVDASDRRERPVLYAVAGGAAAAALAAVLLSGDSVAGRSLGAVLALLAIAALANRWVKASLHVAFASFTAVALAGLGLPVAWAVAAFVPALAWSRLALGRHTPLEVAAGVTLGCAVGTAYALL